MTYKVTVVFGEMNLLTGKMCLSMIEAMRFAATMLEDCLLYTSPSPRD